jgi:hypothetical protein
MAEPTQQGPASIQAVKRDLDREHRHKSIVFCVALGLAIFLSFDGTGNTFARGACLGLLFAIVVDLLSIRRCQRICKAINLNETKSNMPEG